MPMSPCLILPFCLHLGFHFCFCFHPCICISSFLPNQHQHEHCNWHWCWQTTWLFWHSTSNLCQSFNQDHVITLLTSISVFAMCHCLPMSLMQHPTPLLFSWHQPNSPSRVPLVKLCEQRMAHCNANLFSLVDLMFLIFFSDSFFCIVCASNFVALEACLGHLLAVLEICALISISCLLRSSDQNNHAQTATNNVNAEHDHQRTSACKKWALVWKRDAKWAQMQF